MIGLAAHLVSTQNGAHASLLTLQGDTGNAKSEAKLCNQPFKNASKAIGFLSSTLSILQTLMETMPASFWRPVEKGSHTRLWCQRRRLKAGGKLR